MKKILLKSISLIMAITMILSFTACGSGTTIDGTNGTSNKNSAENNEKLKAMNISKIDDYLYSITIDDYDVEKCEFNSALKMKSTSSLEQAANSLINEEYNLEDTTAAGGCASAVNGNFYGRNYDWNYDDEAYFVINVPAKEGRHASIGITGALKALTAEVVDSGVWNDAYDALACTTLDGINDAGLTANIHVVPTGENGITTGTNPGKDDMCATRLVRAVLDNCDSVDSAIEYINNHNVYCPDSLFMQQEFHFRLADSTKTVVIEFIDNKMEVLEDEMIATNFYLYDFDKTEETLQEIPEGIERYNILAENYDTASTKEGMIKLMESINFSKAYDFSTVPFWYSEFSGRFSADTYGTLTSSMFGDPDLSDGDLTKAGAYESIITWKSVINSYGRAKATDEYNSWITCYTSVYDMANKTLTVIPQETGREYTFELNK